ncbi:GH12 family glycosyl hydrolase domain-containing protein [Flindersiella endophytica]
MRRSYRALAGGLLVAGLLGAGLSAAIPAQADTLTCEKFANLSIQSGRYRVQNNVWGADTQQCINVTNTGFQVTTANHNKPTNGAPASYPSVYFGCHYANCSAGSGLPMQASNSAFNSIRTSVSMTYPGGGTWDAAYDVWFDPTPRTDGQNTGAEIMIWLNRQGSIQPVGSQVGTATINGATWNVWFGNIGWNVVSYVRQSSTSSMDFLVNDFYGDAINRGYAQRSWYLTSIQAGFEPWVGGAGLAVNNFSVTSSGGGGGGGGGGGTTACRVGYRPTSWNNGFTADLTLTNTGSSTINGWTAGFSFPGNQQVTNAWGATVTQNGQAVTARNMAYNNTIAPGASQTFGFQGTYSGTNASPTNFTINGTTCSTG